MDKIILTEINWMAKNKDQITLIIPERVKIIAS